MQRKRTYATDEEVATWDLPSPEEARLRRFEALRLSRQQAYWGEFYAPGDTASDEDQAA